MCSGQSLLDPLEFQSRLRSQGRAHAARPGGGRPRPSSREESHRQRLGLGLQSCSETVVVVEARAPHFCVSAAQLVPQWLSWC